MRMIDPMLMELEQEAATTRRVLERIPGDQPGWKPQPKARCLGGLAVRVATAQRGVTRALQQSPYERAMRETAVPATTEEIVAMFDESAASTKAMLSGMSDDDLMSSWSMTREGVARFTAPKAGVVRMIVLTHIYHHRGQLVPSLRQ